MPDKGTCKGCGVAIFWVKNERGKPEPFDQKPARVLMVEGDVQPDGNVWSPFLSGGDIIVAHLPHFVTCPQASHFKRPKNVEKPK